MSVGLPSAVEITASNPDVETGRGGLRLIRAAIAVSVFMFGMLGGAGIAAWVMPPV